MEKTRIAIVGPGLAGLHAAWLLRPELGREDVVESTKEVGILQPYFFSLLSVDNAVQR